MEFGVIAAGEGSRLLAEGWDGPKPLVLLQQKPLLQRLIDSFTATGATGIHIVINEYSPKVEAFLNTLKTEVPLNIIRKTTPSSLHSFHEIISATRGEQICVTTVDTVFQQREFESYIEAFRTDDTSDALMAVTAFVDDESPLFIAADNAMRIIRYADEKDSSCNFVSGGIYCLKRSVFEVVNDTVASGIFRMRNFQRKLVEKGFVVKGYEFEKIVDIDHVADIQVAEEWLAASETRH